MGLIYKITNKNNLQSYIGKTKRDFHTRWLEHLRDSKNPSNAEPLHLAIKKYGEENFFTEILEDDISDEKLNEKEQFYINYYDTYHNGYNATLGGDGGVTWSKLSKLNYQKRT